MGGNIERRDLIKYLYERRKSTRKASIRPLEGPYYFIPLPEGGFDIYAYPTDLYGENITHVEVWRRDTASTFGYIWDLPNEVVEKLKNHPYGVPRGRVSIGVGRIWINHGGDYPQGISEEVKMVIDEFNLQGLSSKGKIKVSFDNHEVMQKQDKRAIENAMNVESRVSRRRGR